jgi:hypothetical protein
MNKHLYLRLLQRGAIRTIKELEARDRIVERSEPYFSTEQAQRDRTAENKNKGCIAASNAIRSRNAFDASRIRSGRTSFFTSVGGKIVSFQEFNVRVMRETRNKK